jgi:endoglucanase
LHERLGVGWVFWPYKSLDTTTAVVSIREPADWALIARAGSTDTIEPGMLPPRGQALKILDAYLEAVKFENNRINRDYLNSLGLSAP